MSLIVDELRLISREYRMRGSKGLVQVYTGNGKGKTTAAIGAAVRAAGHGWRIVIIQFMKGRDYGELKALSGMEQITIEQHGRDEFVDPKNPAAVDIELAERGWAKAKEIASSGDVDMLILDEINVALSFKLLSLDEVKEFIVNKPSELDVILTGRYAADEIIELADTVTEMKEIKHHYNSGVKAREGIEY